MTHMQPQTEIKPLSALSEAASALVIKLRMQCNQPHLADEAKELFDKLLWSNRIQEIAESEIRDSCTEASVQAAKEAMVECGISTAMSAQDVISRAKMCSQSLGKLVEATITSMAKADHAEESSAHGLVNYHSPKPMKGTWAKIQLDHSILLALTRAYRCIIDSSDETLKSYGHTRVSLAHKIRGLELKASLRGVEI